jgi:predicted class III extradiol MEMO1 family dioxygenase
MTEITIPKRLRPIIQAFNAPNEAAAKALIVSSVKMIHYDESKIPSEEIESVMALMQALAPKDMIEMIYCAQIVSAHLYGLKLLSHDYSDDQHIGLKMLKFSNEVLNQLHKKRRGGTNQNINITYNHSGGGPALMQTILPKEETCQ